MDFTLGNPAIRDYFTGRSEAPPVSEAIYLHTHPLVRPNFLTEIMDYIDEQGCKMASRGMETRAPVNELIQIVCEMGELMESLNHSSAPRMLALMKSACDILARVTGRPLVKPG